MGYQSHDGPGLDGDRGLNVLDVRPLHLEPADLDDQLACGQARLAAGDVDAERSPLQAPTRRRFLKWAAGAVTGASMLTGKLVGFTPSAEAAPYSCSPYDPLGDFCFNCTGVCNPFQSCCKALLGGLGGNPYCCCTCAAGPSACSPQFFEAENYCQLFQALCCCGTC